MAVAKTGDERTAPIGPEHSGGRQVADLLVGEEGGLAGRGKKSGNCRCGRTIEAQPVPGQTCLIEPADVRRQPRAKEYDNGKRDLMIDNAASPALLFTCRFSSGCTRYHDLPRAGT